MIIGIEELHRLVKEKSLVEGLSERELKNPEGAGFDLRLGEVYKIKGKAHLGIDHRDLAQAELLKSFDPQNPQTIVLKPGDYLLAKTLEKVNLPSDILALFLPRSSLFRSGVSLFTTQAAPGYQGELVFGIANLGPIDVTIELGARFAHVIFLRVEGGSSSYRGQWQGGRVTTKGKEKQV